jgi:hypothetical protein
VDRAPGAKAPKVDGHHVVPRKTLWDWLQMPFIPAVLASGAFLFNDYQSDISLRLAVDQQREQSFSATWMQ